MWYGWSELTSPIDSAITTSKYWPTDIREAIAAFHNCRHNGADGFTLIPFADFVWDTSELLTLEAMQ
jgi:hypothetical protein